MSSRWSFIKKITILSASCMLGSLPDTFNIPKKCKDLFFSFHISDKQSVTWVFVPRLPQRTRHLMDEAELIPQESGPWRTEVLSLGCWSQKGTTVHRLCQADSAHLGTNCI